MNEEVLGYVKQVSDYLDNFHEFSGDRRSEVLNLGLKAALNDRCVQHYVLSQLISNDSSKTFIYELLNKVFSDCFSSAEVKGLDEDLVPQASEFIKDYYGQGYGYLASKAFDKDPFKYETKVFVFGCLQGVMSYSSHDDRIKIKLLAGTIEALESFIDYLEPADKLISLLVPESLEDHLARVKNLGFAEVKKDYSDCLNEYLLVMKYSGDTNGKEYY
jgi:hypothetical protein